MRTPVVYDYAVIRVVPRVEREEFINAGVLISCQATRTLVAAMARQGFANYSKEWWHFSLPGAGGAAYDFPIVRAR